MDMPTDTERRDVAARLRQAWANVPDANPVRHHLRVLCAIYEAVGVSDGESDAIDLFDRLADLLEPDMTTDTTKNAQDTTKCDREALLALADEIEDNDVTYSVSAQYVLDGYARRIREALGVEDDHR